MRPGGQYTRRVTNAFLPGSGAPTREIQSRILLYDFWTGEPDIRREHQFALDRYVTPLLNQGGLDAWVGGLASRAGGERLNESLAYARAHAVANRIQYRVDRRFGLTVTSFGERRSRGSENSEYYRSVLIVITQRPRIEVPPVRREPTPLPFSNKFKISLTFGFEGGEILVVGRYHFLIDYDDHDPDAPPSDETHYVMTAGGFGGGAPVSSSGGIAWNRFTLAGLATPRDFDGWGRMGGASVSVGAGVGYGTLRLMPDDKPEVYIENFQVEGSFNLGASMITGPFSRSEE